MATSTPTPPAGAAGANVWSPKPAESAAPLAPASLEETGLTSAFIADLSLKILYGKGQCTAQEISDLTCLPLKILAPSLDFLKSEHLVEVKGSSGIAVRRTSTSSYRRAPSARARRWRATATSVPRRSRSPRT